MGTPEVRILNIEKLRVCNGFNLLHTYLLARLPYCIHPMSVTFTTTDDTLSINGTSSTNESDINSNVAVPTIAMLPSPTYCFPSLETLYHILSALFDTLPIHPVTEQKGLQQEQEKDAINISNAVVKYFRQLAADDIQKLAIKYVTRNYETYLIVCLPHIHLTVSNFTLSIDL
jgi:hypothetical protein